MESLRVTVPEIWAGQNRGGKKKKKKEKSKKRKMNIDNPIQHPLWGSLIIIIVTQPLYESRMNWVHDPAPTGSRRPTENIDDAPTAAITSASPGAPCIQPQPKKSRRRRRRKNHRSANQNSAHRSTAPVTPDERWANRNSASLSSTRPKPAANDLPRMMSTPVYHRQGFHSSHLPQPPIPAADENSAFYFGLERGGIPGLYKPSQPDPRQDSTATHSRDSISGFGLSSPSLLQPCTKPFSGLPSRHSKTSPT